MPVSTIIHSVISRVVPAAMRTMCVQRVGRGAIAHCLLWDHSHLFPSCWPAGLPHSVLYHPMATNTFPVVAYETRFGMYYTTTTHTYISLWKILFIFGIVLQILSVQERESLHHLLHSRHESCSSTIGIHYIVNFITDVLLVA